MANEKNLDDQFNVLFDDITEELKEDLGGAADEAKEIAVEAADLQKDIEITVFDTERTEDPEALKKAEQRYREDREEEPEDEEEDLPVKKTKPVKDKVKPVASLKKEQEKKENIRFWVFTAIIALLVLATVLFILYKRGLIFNSEKENEAPTNATVESTEPSVPVDESTTDEEETSEDEESDTEETETSEADDKSAVLENYENLFVVSEDITVRLNLRSTPGGQVIGELYPFAGGNIIGEDGDWYKVQSGDLTGFVSKQFCITGEDAEALAVEHAEKRVLVIAESGLNLRSQPSSNSETVCSAIQTGAVLEYKGEEDGFYRVLYRGSYEGYVSADPQFTTLTYLLQSACMPTE